MGAVEEFRIGIVIAKVVPGEKQDDDRLRTDAVGVLLQLEEFLCRPEARHPEVVAIDGHTPLPQLSLSFIGPCLTVGK